MTNKELTDKEIKRLIIGQGGGDRIAESREHKIERFYKNGQMAEVEWFRRGDMEINGRYVVSVVYKGEEPTDEVVVTLSKEHLQAIYNLVSYASGHVSIDDEPLIEECIELLATHLSNVE